MLKLDFYESGVGETIIITFPSGKIGVVDAHPSSSHSRPPIATLVQGKHAYFVCLTHPHADHGKDLAAVFDGIAVDSFWHTIDDFRTLFFCLEQNPTFRMPAPLAQVMQDMKLNWMNFLKKLFLSAKRKNVPHKTLKDDLAVVNYEGAEISFLSPAEAIKEKWLNSYQERAQIDSDNPKIKPLPDPNEMSAVLAIKYGDNVALLGADALKLNWNTIVPLYQKQKLPKASILKVPHHGAANSLHLDPIGHQHSYLEVVGNGADISSVLFAGDVDHPDPKVAEKIASRTTVFAFHATGHSSSTDPLGLGIHPGFKSAGSRVPLFHTISAQMPLTGKVTVTASPIVVTPAVVAPPATVTPTVAPHP